MATNVKSALIEMNTINKEISIRSMELKKLRERKNKLEEIIKNYIDQQDIPGVKSGNIQVILNSKTTRERKKKDDKIKDALNLLHRAGVSNPERLFKELTDSQKGNEITVKKLKIMGDTK